MSRDSTYTYVHTHSSHHADLFEEFCRPPSSTTQTTSSSTSNAQTNANTQSGTNANNSSDPGMIHIPGHFLPFEEIQLPSHLMPVNPEDEDDVVPDMHAAFGIQRALGGQGGADGGANGEASGRGVHSREPVWRDLGMERLLESGGVNGGGSGRANGVDATLGAGGRREGRRTGMLLLR